MQKFIVLDRKTKPSLYHLLSAYEEVRKDPKVKKVLGVSFDFEKNAFVFSVVYSSGEKKCQKN